MIGVLFKLSDKLEFAQNAPLTRWISGALQYLQGAYTAGVSGDTGTSGAEGTAAVVLRSREISSKAARNGPIADNTKDPEYTVNRGQIA